MKEFFEEKGYQQWIEYDQKEATKWSCTCPDFVHRQIHKEPIGKCKHIIYIAINQSKQDSLTETKKELLRKFVDYICENCHTEDKKLTPHRIKRGYTGGRYELRNIKMVCLKCHKAIHQGEFR